MRAIIHYLQNEYGSKPTDLKHLQLVVNHLEDLKPGQYPGTVDIVNNGGGSTISNVTHIEVWP